MAFVSLVLAQFFKAYNYRSDRLSVFQGPFVNKWLNLAILWEQSHARLRTHFSTSTTTNSASPRRTAINNSCGDRAVVSNTSCIKGT